MPMLIPIEESITLKNECSSCAFMRVLAFVPFTCVSTNSPFKCLKEAMLYAEYNYFYIPRIMSYFAQLYPSALNSR